ncbi:hypothetical protein [Microbacterium sp. zg-YB36]|uniref:hypothetical protein n=1 Tax=Microbacterium sp. zg-YB36 TaxID=2969407 RepID=UPI00214AEE11|nr:hypothetical protein [Microbacterium sp. zg-YB36]MDL5351130.1 hypothetical protein [Microbacterium sp. zg-YB36]
MMATQAEIEAASLVLWNDYEQQYDATGVDVSTFYPLAIEVLNAAAVARTLTTLEKEDEA